MNDKVRIDVYLANQYKLSRNKVNHAIRNGQVTVDGVVINSPGFCLHLAEEPRIVFDQSGLNECQQINTTIIPTKMNLAIVYEDRYLMIVNKPSGQLTHPTHYLETDTLANGIANYLRSFESNRSGILHRLDRLTSGLVLVAKDLATLRKLQNQLAAKQIDRVYLAIVQGNFVETEGQIDAMIGYCGHQKLKMKINGVNAKEAITKFFVLSQAKQLALVACQLFSGRTHQIRVHLSYINHPLLNDPLYGKAFDSNYGQFLHAYMLKFKHPWSHKQMCICVNPDEIFIQKLRDSHLKFNPELVNGKI